MDSSYPTEDATVQEGETIEISNEFAEVHVRKIKSPRGERLEIESPGLGHRIRVDAVALESLSWQDTDLFSKFLTEPLGPKDDEEESSLGWE